MADSSAKHVERAARLRWVPMAKMKVSPFSQRLLIQARVDHLLANFDPEQMGAPTVNERDGWYYILDGQHRIAALRSWLGEEQTVQCWTYVGLSESDEAEKWLQLNDTLTPSAFDKYEKSVNAGRPLESDIDRILRSLDLVAARSPGVGGVRAVGTLARVYKRSDPSTVARTLRIIRDAYGDAGMDARVIDGIGHLCQRYNGTLDDDEAIRRLGAVHGGLNGLTGKAEKLHKETHAAKAQCVAAAAVEIINRGRGGKKLPSWWKADEA